MDFQLDKKSDTLYSVTTTFDDTKEVYTVAEFILCSGAAGIFELALCGNST